MVDIPATEGRTQNSNRRTVAGQDHRKSAVVLPFQKENKTRTLCNCDDWQHWRGRPLASAMGIRRAWRQVVDFGDPKSSGMGDCWGYKTVSVPRVSILDAPAADEEPNSS